MHPAPSASHASPPCRRAVLRFVRDVVVPTPSIGFNVARVVDPAIGPLLVSLVGACRRAAKLSPATCTCCPARLVHPTLSPLLVSLVGAAAVLRSFRLLHVHAVPPGWCIPRWARCWCPWWVPAAPEQLSCRSFNIGGCTWQCLAARSATALQLPAPALRPNPAA